jgi:hypothetical protein
MEQKNSDDSIETIIKEIMTSVTEFNKGETYVNSSPDILVMENAGNHLLDCATTLSEIDGVTKNMENSVTSIKKYHSDIKQTFDRIDKIQLVAMPALLDDLTTLEDLVLSLESNLAAKQKKKAESASIFSVLQYMMVDSSSNLSSIDPGKILEYCPPSIPTHHHDGTLSHAAEIQLNTLHLAGYYESI